MARETMRKISFKPTNRGSSHAGLARLARQAPDAGMRRWRSADLCPGGAGFRHPQQRNSALQLARPQGGRCLAYYHALQ
jgi:hypothetical protein